MNQAAIFNFVVDEDGNKISVEKSFDAPVDVVWDAWTKSEILDLWWAPKPWRAETKSMNFKEGGRWLYAMVGPEGEKHWSLFDYKEIVPQKRFSGVDAFCDEQGHIAEAKPRSLWKNRFIDDSERTIVQIDLHFDSAAHLQQILDMGFKEGFTMGLDNLDEYLVTRKNS